MAYHEGIVSEYMRGAYGTVGSQEAILKISTLLAQSAAREGISLNATQIRQMVRDAPRIAEAHLAAQSGITGTAMSGALDPDELRERVEMADMGRSRFFQSALGDAWRAGGVLPTGAARGALNARFAPMSQRFDMLSGMGRLGTDAETDVPWRQWLRTPGAQAGRGLRDLTREVAGLFGRDFGEEYGEGIMGPSGQPLTFGDTPVGQMQQTYLTGLANDPTQQGQFDLAYGAAEQDIPYHMRDAFRTFANRRFNRFITENPDRSFLPHAFRTGTGRVAF